MRSAKPFAARRDGCTKRDLSQLRRTGRAGPKREVVLEFLGHVAREVVGQKTTHGLVRVKIQRSTYEERARLRALSLSAQETSLKPSPRRCITALTAFLRKRTVVSVWVLSAAHFLRRLWTCQVSGAGRRIPCSARTGSSFSSQSARAPHALQRLSVACDVPWVPRRQRPGPPRRGDQSFQRVRSLGRLLPVGSSRYGERRVGGLD
jgi:hypothetical protein